MKKVAILVLLLLTACSKESTPLTLKGFEFNPTEIRYKQNSVDHQRTTVIIKNKEVIQEINQYFNEGDYVYQRSVEELAYYDDLISGVIFEIQFEDEQNHFLKVKAYEAEMSQNREGYVLCINDEEVCKEFYPRQNLSEIVLKSSGEEKTYAYNKVKLREIMNGRNSFLIDNSNKNSILELPLYINESFTDIQEVQNIKPIISALINTDALGSYAYFKVQGETAKAYGTNEVINQHKMKEDFSFYTFNSVEAKGKELFGNNFSLSEFEDGTNWEDLESFICVDTQYQGFKVIRRYAELMKQCLIPIDYESSPSKQSVIYARAYVVQEVNNNTLLNKDGERIAYLRGIEDAYEYVYDRLDEFDVIELDCTMDKVNSINFIHQVDEKRAQELLSLGDFHDDINKDGKRVISCDSSNLDKRVLERFYLNEKDQVTFRENEEYINIRIYSINLNTITSILFDKKTGDNLTNYDLNQRYEGKLVNKIHEQITKVVTQQCPMYYEEAYLLDQCYLPLEIKDHVENNQIYDEVGSSTFYLNEESKFGMDVRIREKGASAKMQFIEIKK